MEVNGQKNVVLGSMAELVQNRTNSETARCADSNWIEVLFKRIKEPGKSGCGKGVNSNEGNLENVGDFTWKRSAWYCEEDTACDVRNSDKELQNYANSERCSWNKPLPPVLWNDDLKEAAKDLAVARVPDAAGCDIFDRNNYLSITDSRADRIIRYHALSTRELTQAEIISLMTRRIEGRNDLYHDGKKYTVWGKDEFEWYYMSDLPYSDFTRKYNDAYCGYRNSADSMANPYGILINPEARKMGCAFARCSTSSPIIIPPNHFTGLEPGAYNELHAVFANCVFDKDDC